MLHKAHLYAHTLRHLKPWQVAGRIAASARRGLGLSRLPRVPAPLESALQISTPFPQHDPWNTRKRVLRGEFCFLNQREHLGRPIKWAARDMPLLWRFNLHYFHYLHLLEEKEQAALCQDWRAKNPPGTPVAWHPYPTALRIVNWCRAGLDHEALLESLYLQAAHLYRNLETYIYGNHLLENARALVVAGCYFGDAGEAPRWLRKGLAIYRKESREQILPDGGHYERSPMYHALMLEGFLDVINCLPEDHEARPELVETADRMWSFYVSMLRPDGQLPLFNDATHEIALPPKELCAYAGAFLAGAPARRAAFPDTGYYIFRDDHVYLAIDGGPAGPDHLMAHAHADIFSYELVVGGMPFIVDAGVYEYQAGVMRDYVRSTAAHNTLTVDETDQVECWSSFRVARRFAPKLVSFTGAAPELKFAGAFSGYAALIGDDITHRRVVTIRPDLRAVTVEDEVSGTGEHRVESRIHLHPEVSIEGNERDLRLQRGDAVCRLEVESAPIRREEGWYCPQFGVREKNTVLVLGGLIPLPTRLTYVIRY